MARTRSALSFSLLAALTLFPSTASALSLITDPIPEPIVPSGLRARLVDVVEIPASSVSRPLARLNLLGHAGDDSGRLFVNDMRGRIYIVEHGDLRDTPFLDVATVPGIDFVSSGLQLGFSTFAFHPDYANESADGFGRFYTVTSEAAGAIGPDFEIPAATPTHLSVLSEWRVDANDANRIDPGSRRVILSVAEPSVDHNMGQIGFNPNARPPDGSFSGDPDFGMLYIAQGDGGAYNGSLGPGVDPIQAGQDLSNPFGSILRIDPLGNDADNGAYGIPTDNPFVASGDGKRDEIWAYGLRNPHRFSWDTGGDGAMIISDIGQGNIEELDIGLPGANYGWSEREGTFVFDRTDPFNLMSLPVDDALFGYTYPVAQYDHDEGRAIVGGFVYRGSRIPDLVGMYVFGDLVNGRIFYVDADALADGSQAEIHELTLVYGDATRTLLDIVGGPRADLRFGIGEDHEIYVLTKRDGMVRALVPEPSGAALLALGLAALAFQRRNRGLACTPPTG